MEFVRLRYANNKLITSSLKEHREVIEEYINKKHMEYLGFIPVLFEPNGKIMEMDLIFKDPTGNNASEKENKTENKAHHQK